MQLTWKTYFPPPPRRIYLTEGRQPQTRKSTSTPRQPISRRNMYLGPQRSPTQHLLKGHRRRRVFPPNPTPLTPSREYMEERLEYNIIWSINPFVHNPYHKAHRRHHGAMMTVQQIQRLHPRRKRRESVDAHAVSVFEPLCTPKASYAELFYDLFFVASLTSFGIKHEVTQAQAIASYVAFFTVLWCALRFASLLTGGGCGLPRCCMMSALKRGTLSTAFSNFSNSSYSVDLTSAP
jgi:hypothetical protein